MNSKLSMSRFFTAILFVITISVCWPMSAIAMDLQQAKNMGAVGEMQSGYLGVVSSAAPDEVKALVAGINEKRKSVYQDIAKRNGTSLAAVEKLAGGKAISKTLSGQYIMSPSGEWMKK